MLSLQNFTKFMTWVSVKWQFESVSQTLQCIGGWVGVWNGLSVKTKHISKVPVEFPTGIP
jgi:hypothetical protein